VRVVVVGGGIIGLLTAMECVRSGAQVDLVDQGTIPSAGAASNDTQRIVRALHSGDPQLTAAAAGAGRAWLEVQRCVGAWFYRRMGVLTMMAAQDAIGNLALLAGVGVRARMLSAGELAARYPRIRVAAGTQAVFEPTAGIILADQALRMVARWLRDETAAVLHDGCRVDVTCGEWLP
jgi:glycine/D-amino acid oxidase-like deaminating enzyme